MLLSPLLFERWGLRELQIAHPTCCYGSFFTTADVATTQHAIVSVFAYRRTWSGVVTGGLMLLSPLLFERWGWRDVAIARLTFAVSFLNCR
jgi:hypothetical protein